MSTKIYDIYTPASVQNQPSDESEIQTECKNVIHIMIPLGMEMSSAGIFLMDRVDIRLRFDLSSASHMINTASADSGYKYIEETEKLLTQS